MRRMVWLAPLLLSACNRAPHLVTPMAQPPFIHNCMSFFVAALVSDSASPFVPGTTAADYRRYVGCATGAADCASALRCASRNHDPMYCTAHPGNGCDGDLLVQCPAATATADWAIYTTDCAALGLHCAQANGSASCTDGAICDHTSFFDHCDGNVAVKCDPHTNLRSSVDCGLWPDPNTACQQGGAVGCFPTGPPCQNESARCDGDVVVRCGGNVEERFDCTQIASRCRTASNGVAECVPIASQCSDASTSDSCIGTSIRTCQDGVVYNVDCAEIGFPTCSLTSGGAPVCD